MRADLESCRSGRTGRIRNPLYPQGYPGFESLALRQINEKTQPRLGFFIFQMSLSRSRSAGPGVQAQRTDLFLAFCCQPVWLFPYQATRCSNDPVTNQFVLPSLVCRVGIFFRECAVIREVFLVLAAALTAWD